MNGDKKMKKNKLLKLVIIGCMTVFALTACGDKKEDTKNSETTAKAEESTKEVEINIKDFTKQIAEKRTDVSLVEMTEEYVKGVMSFDVSKVSEYSVYVDASGTSVDEYGVFKANDDTAEDVEKMLQTYLDMRLDTWMDEYMPEQKPKVENAVINNVGNYYIYAILSDSEREATFSAFEDAAK